MPSLALAISDYNKAGNGPAINLKGFLAGNAWTGDQRSLYSACMHGCARLPVPVHMIDAQKAPFALEHSTAGVRVRACELGPCHGQTCMLPSASKAAW